MKAFRVLLIVLGLLAAPANVAAKKGSYVLLRSNTFSFSEAKTSPKGFSVKAILTLSESEKDTMLYAIPNLLSVRLSRHDPKDIRRQNYPAGKMADGSVPVLEASLMIRLPEGCTPIRDGQPEVQEMVIGVPLGLLDKPFGRHEMLLNYDGVTWDMYLDGQLVDRDFVLGSPASLAHEGSSSSLTISKAYVPQPKKEKHAHRVPVQYFTPRGHNTWVGDVATLWYKGRYHVFYLLDRRGHESKFGRGGHYFEHLSTADFLHWTEHEAAVPIEEQWETLGTGTPFVWHDTLFISYGMHTSRIWPAERTSTPRQWQYIKEHGESEALPFAYPISNMEDFPSGASYSVSANGVANFRKSHVLIHPAENPTIYTDRDGRLCMLANYGARGMWTSDRLDGGWRCLSEDFPPGGDCTFIFRWGDYDYIVGGFTHMWMKSASAQADEYIDMVASGKDLYDGLSVPSICELPNGRHLMAGWVEMNRHWGGPLVIRELIQYPDGCIGSRFMPELMPKLIDNRQQTADNGQWPRDGMLSPQKSYLLTFDVEPEATGGQLSLHLSSDDTQQECVWTLDTRERTARFGEGKSLRNGGQPQRATDFAIESLRGIEKPFTVRIIILNNPKFGGSLLDVEIAGQRTMISHREGLGVGAFRFESEGLTIRKLEVNEIETAQFGFKN